jgi:hypothetical protein
MWATSLLVLSQEHHERQRHRQIGLVCWKLTCVPVYPVIIIAGPQEEGRVTCASPDKEWPKRAFHQQYCESRYV